MDCNDESFLEISFEASTEDPGLVNHRTRDFTFDMTEDPGLINHRTRDLNMLETFSETLSEVWSVCLYLSLKEFPFLALLFFQFFDRGIMI
jgi:hypothetical protein